MLIKYLIVLLVSMLPIVELRGAIPYAVSFNIPLIPAFIVAIIGNMLPVPFIYLFARKFLTWGVKQKHLKKFCKWCLVKGEHAGDKLKKSGQGIYIGLMLFVGVPLPGTGAWTGTLAASFLDLDFKKSVLAIMGGVIIAGIIMAILSIGLFKGILA